MALTLAQFSNLGLTAAQQAKIQAAIDIGNELALPGRPGAPAIDLSTLTPAQAKAIENFIRDVNSLLGPAWRAVKYIRQKTKDDAAASADAAVTTGTL